MLRLVGAPRAGDGLPPWGLLGPERRRAKRPPTPRRGSPRPEGIKGVIKRQISEFINFLYYCSTPFVSSGESPFFGREGDLPTEAKQLQ
jgi:hypothetical protein